MLYNTQTRQLLTNDLEELHAYLKHRVYELDSQDSTFFFTATAAQKGEL